MKKLLLFLFCILMQVSTQLSAQSTFQKTFETASGDGGYIVRHTQDNGYVLFSFNILNGYSYIVKTDSLGNKEWSKKIDFGNWNVYARGLNQTNDGGYILSGSVIGVGGYLTKLNSSGNMVWQNTYCFGDCNYVKDDIDGTGYIAAGGFSNGDPILMKIDFSGNLIWHVRMHPTSLFFNTYSGGFVQLPSDSSIITCGSSQNNYTDTVWCAKFSKAGNNIWVKTIIAGPASSMYGNLSIKETYNGNVMVSSGGVFVELDTSGAAVSSMYYNGGGYIEAWDFAKPAIDKSMFITGYIQNWNGTEDIFLLKTNASGNAEWCKRIGGAKSDNASDVTNDGKNGCVVIGSTNSFSGSSNGAIYLVKTDSIGTFSCNADTLPLPTAQFLTATTTDYSCVFTSPSCNNNPVSFNYSNPTDTSYDACGCFPPVADFSTDYPNPNGGWIQDNSTWAATWFWDYGNGQTDSSVIPAPNYTVDSIYNVCLTVTNACGTDSVCHLLNYVYMPVGIQNHLNNSIKQIVPNPSTGDFIISFERTIIKGKIEILNILGENILSENIFNESKKEINLENISPGIYFVKVLDGGKMFTQKIIIQ